MNKGMKQQVYALTVSQIAAGFTLLFSKKHVIRNVFLDVYLGSWSKSTSTEAAS